MSKESEYVMRTVEERGIRFIRLWFTDVLGFLKSVAISPAELEVAFEEGMTFDGSSIDGYARIQEADMLAQLRRVYEGPASLAEDGMVARP